GATHLVSTRRTVASMFAGFAIIVGAVVGYWVYASIRMTQRGHEESGLYGEGVRRTRREERQRRRAENVDAIVARRGRLDNLVDEARSAAWRGVTIAGIDRIGGWLRISFVDGRAWLVRTDTTGPRMRTFLHGPVVIQRAV